MSILSGLLGLGGSLLGGSMQSNSVKDQTAAQIQAAKDQREFDQGNSLDSMARLLQAFYGSGSVGKLKNMLPADQLSMLFGGDKTPDVAAKRQRAQQIQARLAELSRGSASMSRSGSGANRNRMESLYGERQQLEKELSKLNTEISSGSNPARWNESQFTGSQPGFLQQMQDLIGTFDTESQGLLGQYDTETGQLTDMGNQNLQALQGFGDQRKQNVDRDVRRATRSSNAGLAAKFKNSGLGGSSLVPQALSGNTQRLFESGGNAKAGIDDQLMQMMASLREGNLNRLTGRLGSRTNLQQSILGQSQNLRQQPLQAEMNLMTGPAFSPKYDSRSYFPGVTTKGVGTGMFGGMLGAMGGQAVGQSGGIGSLLSQLFGG